MKSKILFFTILFGMTVMCGFVSAYTMDYEYAVDGNNYTSSYSGAIIETFDNEALLWSWSNNYHIVSDSLPGQYSAPHGVSTKDTTQYVSVPKDSGSGYADVSLGGTYNYFGLWWGSVDSYNTLSFYYNESEVATFSGSAVVELPNGNQISDLTNLYVNLYDLPDFDSFRMTSTSYAFEADNIAVGSAPVPEPATFLLLGSGLAGLAFYRRKRK